MSLTQYAGVIQDLRTLGFVEQDLRMERGKLFTYQFTDGSVIVSMFPFDSSMYLSWELNTKAGHLSRVFDSHKVKGDWIRSLRDFCRSALDELKAIKLIPLLDKLGDLETALDKRLQACGGDANLFGAAGDALRAALGEKVWFLLRGTPPRAGASLRGFSLTEADQPESRIFVFSGPLASVEPASGEPGVCVVRILIPGGGLIRVSLCQIYFSLEALEAALSGQLDCWLESLKGQSGLGRCLELANLLNRYSNSREVSDGQ